MDLKWERRVENKHTNLCDNYFAKCATKLNAWEQKVVSAIKILSTLCVTLRQSGMARNIFIYLHSSQKETQLSTVRFFWDWV